jgi:hypothetical protein
MNFRFYGEKGIIMKNTIVEVKFNDELPTRYDYKHFNVILENGVIETFHYHINNPIPTEIEMIGLTWEELIELCKKMFYDKINSKILRK